MSLYIKHGITIPAIASKITFLDPVKYKTEPKDRLSDEKEKSFGEPPDMALLSTGMHVWRFIQNKNRGYYSDCWIDEKTI